MKRIFVVIFLLAVLGNLTAQVGPVIKMDVTRYHFGQIYEKDGIVKCSLDFQNNGTDTLKLEKLKVSDPSLTAKADRDVLAPQEYGTLNITLNPAKCSGRTDRYINIKSNDPYNPLLQIAVSADVISKEKTLEDKFPDKIGNLRLSSKHLAMDGLKNTEIRKDTIRLLNVWTKPMKIGMKDVPAYTTWIAVPPVIQPMKQGLLIVSYDAGKSGNWGLAMNSFTMLTNDSLNPEKTLSIGVNIAEDFSYLNKVPAPKKPKAVFPVVNHDFGKIVDGDVKEYSFVIKNNGEGNLIIRKVKASCGCTAADLKKSEVKPGEETTLDVKFDSSGTHGKQIKTITVICNDPAAPKVLLTIAAEVEPK
jgi:hypothetical protein